MTQVVPVSTSEIQHFNCNFFITDPATTEIYTLSLHDALPICTGRAEHAREHEQEIAARREALDSALRSLETMTRSEEHTSELQSQSNLVCRLLLEKKNKYNHLITPK